MKKRRASGEGSIRKRANGLWEGRFKVRRTLAPKQGFLLMKEPQKKCVL